MSPENRPLGNDVDRNMKKIAVVFGTRPEAIKLAPVVLALRQSQRFSCNVCVTGQHREMLQQVLDVFKIEPDVDLALMKRDQSLAELTSRAVSALDRYFAQTRPDAVVVQGDTTTVLCASLAAFYHHLPIAHVEAGLRTRNLESPWPEEGNRQMTSRLAKWHFAPTESNRRNLLAEGIPDSSIFVTGNTVIDALFVVKNLPETANRTIRGLPGDSLSFLGSSRMVLVTGHRRENFGNGFENICHAIGRLATDFPNVHFIYPVHLNPNVRTPVNRILGRADLSNIHLIEPQDYLSFVALMNRSSVILTDSGGVQEEGPSLGKPVLVMRDTTERPEAVEAGTAKLVGTSSDKIVAETSALLLDSNTYAKMANAVNPYGDGKASQRILEVLSNET